MFNCPFTFREPLKALLLVIFHLPYFNVFSSRGRNIAFLVLIFKVSSPAEIYHVWLSFFYVGYQRVFLVCDGEIRFLSRRPTRVWPKAEDTSGEAARKAAFRAVHPLKLDRNRKSRMKPLAPRVSFFPLHLKTGSDIFSLKYTITSF